MISDIILSFVIIFLLVERYLTLKGFEQERKDWTKGMLARNLRELTDNEALEKLPEQTPEIPPDVVSADEMNEDEELFDKHIGAMKAQAKEELAKELTP